MHSALGHCHTAPRLIACVVDENPPHHLCGKRVELLAVVELQLFLPHEAEPGFVDECRRLQRVVWPFAAQVVPRSSAQLVVDERRQPPKRFLIASPPGAQ